MNLKILFKIANIPNAERRSSTLCILTLSGKELRKCCNSWSVVVLGTSRPLRLPTVNLDKAKNRAFCFHFK